MYAETGTFTSYVYLLFAPAHSPPFCSELQFLLNTLRFLSDKTFKTIAGESCICSVHFANTAECPKFHVRKLVSADREIHDNMCKCECADSALNPLIKAQAFL